jgi:hypothetical protein
MDGVSRETKFAIIASAAKQSSSKRQNLDCFVAKAPRNDENPALEVAAP